MVPLKGSGGAGVINAKHPARTELNTMLFFAY